MQLSTRATKFLIYLLAGWFVSAAQIQAASGPLLPGSPAVQMPEGMSPMLPGGMVPSPGAAPEPTRTPAFAPGGMPTPSSAEIADAFSMVEEMQRNDPAQFHKLEEQGRQMIRELAKHDPGQLENFAKQFGLTAEELVAEAEKPSEPLLPQPAQEDMLEEPEEELPFIRPQETPKPSLAPAPKPAAEAPSEKKPVPVDEGRVRRAIAQVSEHIESLRTKMASSPMVYEELRSLELDLLSLALLISIIDTPEHIKRIATGEYSDLVLALENLATTLLTEEPLIQALRPSQTKYDLLGVSPQVTDTQLEKVFKELKDTLSPAVIEKQLKKEGLTGEDLKRQVKAARITFAELEEAYDLIHDPITRRDIVDREIELEAKEQGLNSASSQAAIKEIREALGTALYKQEIISKMENYLEKYAPEELKLKKALAKEEKKRIDEQKRRARQRAVTTPGESFEPTIRLPHGHGEYGYPGGRSWSPEGYSRQRQGPSDYGSLSKRGPEIEKKRAPDEAGRSSTRQETLTPGEKEAQKIDKRSMKEVISDLDKKFKEFSKTYDAPESKKLMTDAFGTMPQKLKTLDSSFFELRQKLEPTAEMHKAGMEAEGAVGEKKPGEQKSEKEAKEAEEKSSVEKTEQSAGEKEPEQKALKEETTPEKKEATSSEEPSAEKKAEGAEGKPEKLEERVLSEKQNLESDIKRWGEDADALYTKLKVRELYDTFAALANKADMMQTARPPKDEESIAWRKFKTTFEQRGGPAEKAAATTPEAPAAKPKTKAKKRPLSIKGKLAELRKKLTGIEKVEFHDPDLKERKASIFDEFAEQIKAFKGFEKRVDGWFRRIPTVKEQESKKKEAGTGSKALEQKSSEAPASGTREIEKKG
ncbi:MAG: hypothetical protein M1549_03660 [Candidatus Dependentiae bacterium]|nr:hypothetical protein [Candidatus Dependentiae bacterium]